MMRFKPQPPEADKPTKENNVAAGHAPQLQRIPWFTPTNLLLALVVVAGSYLLWRAFDAEQKFRAAIAAAPTDGVATYNILQEALSQNPYNVGYRLTYSQVNFALANTFASREASPSAETQAIIQQLVGQAVREARVALSLSPNDAGSWQNLASFYRALTGLANGAAEWAVGSYQQAVSFSPFDPRLHLDLGGVYFLTGNFAAALDEFTLSAQLKPDYANAHYNRAQALKSLTRKEDALSALNEVLRLLPADSPDREVVEKEMAQLKGELPPSAASAGPRVRPPTGEEVNPPGEASPSAEHIQPPVEVPGPPPEATQPAAPRGPGPIEVIP